MAFDDYVISTKASAFTAGAYVSRVEMVIGLGKRQNPYNNKGPQTCFAIVNRVRVEDGDRLHVKIYNLAWGLRATYYQHYAMLYSADAIKAGRVSPIDLLGALTQLVFTTTRDESGAEKTILAAVGPLPKTTANAEAVKWLRQYETFSCDAATGEKPPLEILNQLPKWLVEQMDQAAPGQPTAPPPTTSWTAPTSPTLAAMQGVPVQPAQHANAAPDFNDTLDDVNW